MVYANWISIRNFFAVSVNERFDKCQVGNIRLKSGLKSLLMGCKHDLIKNESRTTQSANESFFSTLAGLKSLSKPIKQVCSTLKSAKIH